MRTVNMFSITSAALGTIMVIMGLTFGVSPQRAAQVLLATYHPPAASAQESRFSDGAALARASALAQGQLDESVGRDRHVAGANVPALRVDVNDMRLVAQTFRPHAASFSSIAGTHDLGAGPDVWTFEWELRGLSAPQLQMPDAVLRVVIAVEDGTGKLRMGRVSTVNAAYADD